MDEYILIREQISQFFQQNLGLDVPSTDTDLVDAGCLDSLSFVDLILCLEESYGLKLSLDDMEIDNFRSIEKIVRFVALRSPLYVGGIAR